MRRAAQAGAGGAMRLLAGLRRWASACSAHEPQAALWTRLRSPCGALTLCWVACNALSFMSTLLAALGVKPTGAPASGSRPYAANTRRLRTRCVMRALSCRSRACLQPRRRSWQPLETQQRAGTASASAACRSALGRWQRSVRRAPPAPTTTRSPRRARPLSCLGDVCA